MDTEDKRTDVDAQLLGDRIRMAYEAVKAAGITEESLKLEAFRFALRVGDSEDVSGDPATVPARTMRSADEVLPIQVAGTAAMIDSMAGALDVPRDVVELFYDIRDESLDLNVPPKALPASVSAAMREIAIILAVGRKHAGVGAGGTSFELIRRACDEHGKLDKKNFAAAMTGLKPRLTVAGRGAERLLIPKKPADDLARDILFRYYQGIV